MKFIALKTDDGSIKRKISIYCRVLEVSRQAYYEFLKKQEKPWKYEDLAEMMCEIYEEDEYNDTYGRKRMYEALKLKKTAEKSNIYIPSEGTIRKIMSEIGIIHKIRHKPNSITKADKEARKSDDLVKRNFRSEKPLEKAVTDITEIPAKDGKIYISVIFDCFDLMPLGFAASNNMKAELCVKTLENAHCSYQNIKGMIIHSDRGSQYTSAAYRKAIEKCEIKQSMNSAGGRCHDNARCESVWARMKEEVFYSRNRRSEEYTVEELKSMIWRYFMSYWANRRICSANDGLPPNIKRKRYYESITKVA